jgi:hypothetical protein
MDKYQPLRDAGTNGANFDLDTDDVIAHLRGWDAKYGISLESVEQDSVFITFNTLPDDVAGLAADIYTSSALTRSISTSAVFGRSSNWRRKQARTCHQIYWN